MAKTTFCEHCPADGGPCVVCGSYTKAITPEARAVRAGAGVMDAPRTVRVLRALVALAEAEADQLRAELDAALIAAGRRPADGSDQPALFEAEAQAKLF